MSSNSFLASIPLRLTLIFLCGWSMSACNFQKAELPSWEMDLLGPLVKSTVKTSDIPDLQNYTFSKTDELSMVDAGFPLGTIPSIPPFQNRKITVSKAITSDFAMLTFKSGTMALNFTNNFVVNMLSGATITLKANGATIFTHTTTSTIPSNGKYAITNVSLAGVSITDQLTYEITFSSDGAVNGATITNASKLLVALDIFNGTIHEARIKSSYKFSATSASEFSLNPSAVSINEVTGLLTLKVTNRLPFDYTLQAYFSSDKLKSNDDTPLFAATETTLIPSATINATGETTQASEKTLTSLVDVAKYTKIRDANYMLFDISLKSFPSGLSSVAIRQADSVNIKVIADIKLKANSK